MPSKKLTKEQLKATAELSKERLERIRKTRRHHIRTNVRVMKYGAKSFVRNTWLSVAAIAIMAVTLIVLSATLIAAHAMNTVINAVEQRIDMSIYIKQGATEEQVERIAKEIRNLDSVLEVTKTSPEEANNEVIKNIIKKEKITDKDLINSLYEAPNKLPWTLNVKMQNLNNTTELENLVKENETVASMLDENKQPTFATERRKDIDKIANTMNRFEIIGLVAAGVFALIAILVVFNTIRMAIYNRKEEIYMMRLVGASRWFIVGPFVVEASFYGIVAAAIAFAVVYASAFALRSSLASTIDPTLELMSQYWYLSVCSLLVAGILIGVFSSLLATRKYLKQK